MVFSSQTRKTVVVSNINEFSDMTTLLDVVETDHQYDALSEDYDDYMDGYFSSPS